MQRILLTATLVLSSCGSPVSPDVEESNQAPEAPQPAPVAVDGVALAASWRPETIELPTSWGPDLAPGVEELRFAPGMFEAGAVDYWTYAFRIDFEQELAEPVAVTEFLEHYYDGLLGAVGESGEFDAGEDPAQVSIDRVDGDTIYATLNLIDTFVTGDSLKLFLDWETEGKTVRVTASPQPREHEIWHSLRAVVAAL